jgi:hypothetical protein
VSNSIEDAISNVVEQFLHPYLNHFHEYSIDRDSGAIEIRGLVNENDHRKTLVLKVLFSHEKHLAAIPNIFMPEFMKKKGLGKQLIAIIHQALKQYGYQLLIIDLVPSFYGKLVRRGAVICEEGESVLITDETRLGSSSAQPSSQDGLRE